MSFFSRPVVTMPKLTTASAADLAAKSGAAADSQALVKPGMSSSEYVHTLEQNKQSVDAVKALSNGMSEEDAVCWACQSSQKVGDKLNIEEKDAAAAALAWVQNPTDANKAAAALAASKTDFKGPGGWAAQAAAWSTSPTPGKAAAIGIGTGLATAGLAQLTPKGEKPAIDKIPMDKDSLGKLAMDQIPKDKLPTNKLPMDKVPSTDVPQKPSLTAAAVSGAILLAAGLLNGKPMGPPQKPDLKSIPATSFDPNTYASKSAEMPQVDQSKMSKSLQPFLDLGKKVGSGEVSCKG